MKISTKGRYALRVMIDLAEHNTGEYIPLMDIARRQDISEKYLEAIVATLSKNEFLISLRGKGGGYKLARNPEDYSVQAFFSKTAAGGVLVIKLKLLSAYTVITTGMIRSPLSAVLALNSFVNCTMFTPC